MGRFWPEPVRLKTRVSWQPDRVFPEKTHTKKKRKRASCKKQRFFEKKVPFQDQKKAIIPAFLQVVLLLSNFLKTDLPGGGGEPKVFWRPKWPDTLFFAIHSCVFQNA